MELAEKFAQDAKARRKRMKLSQIKAAEYLEIDRRSVQNVETGRMPNVRTFMRMCALYRLNPYDYGEELGPNVPVYSD